MRLDPDLVPDLVNNLCLKDYMCTINPLYHFARISKFQCAYAQFTYRTSDVVRILSTLRNNLERRPYSRVDPGMQPTAVQESSMGPGLSTIYRAR